MASTFSNLGLILMTTGEDSGTWGFKTNVNLQRIDFAMDGIAELTITGSTTLAFSTNLDTTTYSQEAGRAGILVLSGTPGAVPTITVPNIEKQYLINNTMSTSATFSAGTGASTVSVGAGSKTIIYVDGSDEVIEGISATNPGGSDTQIQFNNSGSFGGSANLIWDGTNLNIGATGEIRLQDTTGGEYVGLKSAGTVATAYTLTLPTTSGSAGQVLTVDGSANLSFADISGGASWQAVITADPANAVAGNGYFCNTTGGAFTVTLPTSPTLGDFISFIDYAGTFDTNNLTIARNGKNIQGVAEDLTVSVERAGLTLVFVDNTQGWLLQNK
jgi:hypothetical protein